MVDLTTPRDGYRGPDTDQTDRPSEQARSPWRRPAVLTAVSVLLVAAVAFTVWNRYLSQASPANPGTTCPAVVQPTDHLPFAAIGVKRVALIGDSIMYLSSCSVAAGLARVGVETGRYAVSGTGLLSGWVNWLNETQLILATFHPNAVIAIFVGNYLRPTSPDAYHVAVADDSPAFFALWQQRAEALSQEVHRAGADMYWVSPPPIQSPPLDHAQRLYEGYRSIPGDHTIEAGSILAGASGSEAPTKKTCGKTVVVRTPDGVHLTDDGARIYGEEIAHLFTAETGVLTSPRPC